MNKEDNSIESMDRECKQLMQMNDSCKNNNMDPRKSIISQQLNILHLNHDTEECDKSTSIKLDISLKEKQWKADKKDNTEVINWLWDGIILSIFL